MRSVINTSALFALGAFLTLSTVAKGQSTMIAALAQPDSLAHQELGEAAAEDYAAHPYGEGHLLFLSTRNGTMMTAKDPQTNAPFARPYLLRLKDLKTLPYALSGILAEQTYHIGQCALLPDSSALIASHSRKKPYKDGRIGMTLTYIPFNGDAAKTLPFVDENADYQHPWFDAKDYTLYFASNIEGGKGGYDLYKSTLSFDGVWSAPQSVEIANTPEDEVFPSTSEDLDLFFSRASKNYGLQLYQHSAGDSTPVAMALNNRGDEFGLVLLNDSTALFSQSKRPGSPTNLQLYSLPIPPPPPPIDTAALAAQALEDSLTKAALKADSIAAFNLANASEKAAASTKGTKWVTDNTPKPGTTSGYSLIVGGFVDRDLAEGFLESIVGWAPEAFLSRYNKKYYVVHSVHKYRDDANAAKASVNKRDYRAWVLSKGLQTL
ncbi:hypothetical protein N9W87_01505 [Schleiferiaceae bacterium]|nr:hypothetical protein [Schleiferiaceae bacterium]MDC0972636.1 hypothetical protein [bacterium]